MSFFVSFVVYTAICWVWPTGNQKLIREMGLGWEQASGDVLYGLDGTEIVEEGNGVYARDSSGVVTQEAYTPDFKY